MTDDKKAQSTANALYTRASAALRDAHREEFNALLDAEYEKAGQKRIVRKSAEERAAEKAAADEAKREAKEAARLEKALAAARALAAEFPEFVAVNEPVVSATVEADPFDLGATA